LVTWPWLREFVNISCLGLPAIKLWAYAHMCLFRWQFTRGRAGRFIRCRVGRRPRRCCALIETPSNGSSELRVGRGTDVYFNQQNLGL
jgi:hypothetical protein